MIWFSNEWKIHNLRNICAFKALWTFEQALTTLHAISNYNSEAGNWKLDHHQSKQGWKILKALGHHYLDKSWWLRKFILSFGRDYGSLQDEQSTNNMPPCNNGQKNLTEIPVNNEKFVEMKNYIFLGNLGNSTFILISSWFLILWTYFFILSCQ